MTRELDALREAIRNALDELGVPGEGYPAPVANAVEILRAALASEGGFCNYECPFTEEGHAAMDIDHEFVR